MAGGENSGRNWAAKRDKSYPLWIYDSETKTYLNIHRRISSDGGRAWSEARGLGFTDQASHPAILGEGRVVLAWVDRFKTTSIRARLAQVSSPLSTQRQKHSCDRCRAEFKRYNDK